MATPRTNTALESAPPSNEDREAYYGRIAENNMTPLWEVLQAYSQE